MNKEEKRLAEIIYHLKRGKVVVSLEEWLKYHGRIKRKNFELTLNFYWKYYGPSHCFFRHSEYLEY